ncbi:cell division topological specificity factor MinE [Vallitalea pronyensis]|uniref:Cell division topological specificity factor n=1 Tax=Vallitalea pronyensis TaxID=1348613 RepID=A0A8J8SHF4_9FIRM|nr:cell division topological specificity factor MinE [Vallitalea pronyensis]QUI23338.1 cell division topological specificity factor MinE [Vallitalea pronyensis]
MPLLSRKTSKRVAKDRLKLVLIHDRANCSPELLDMIKTDIIKVISKYMEIDEEGLDVKMGNTKSEISDDIVPALYANIPIKKMRKAK